MGEGEGGGVGGVPLGELMQRDGAFDAGRGGGVVKVDSIKGHLHNGLVELATVLRRQEGDALGGRVLLRALLLLMLRWWASAWHVVLGGVRVVSGNTSRGVKCLTSSALTASCALRNPWVHCFLKPPRSSWGGKGGGK